MRSAPTICATTLHMTETKTCSRRVCGPALYAIQGTVLTGDAVKHVLALPHTMMWLFGKACKLTIPKERYGCSDNCRLNLLQWQYLSNVSVAQTFDLYTDFILDGESQQGAATLTTRRLLADAENRTLLLLNGDVSYAR